MTLSVNINHYISYRNEFCSLTGQAIIIIVNVTLIFMCGVHNYTRDLTVAIKSLLTYHEGASYRRKASHESIFYHWRTEELDLLHSDICGKMNTKSLTQLEQCHG